MIKFTQKRICVCALLLRGIMDWYYLSYVSPIWGYMGMETHVNMYKLCISYLLQFVLTIVMDWKSENVSGMALQVLYMITMTPLLSYYALADQSSMFTLVCVLSFIISAIVVRTFPRMKSHVVIILSKQRESYRILFCVGLIVVLVFALFFIQANGLNLGTLNIFNSELIYQIRAEGKGLNGVMAYAYGWIYRIIIPLFTAYCMHKRRIMGVFLSIVLMLGLYLSDPHKEIILGIALVVIIYIFGRKIKYGYLLMLGFTASIAAGLIIYFVFDSKLAFYELDIFMRVFHIPASVKFLHYRYFSIFPKLYFSEGHLGRLFGAEYPYNTSVGYVIGMYFKGVETNDNAGYLAYSYDNFGYIGVILAGVLLAFILRWMDAYVTDNNRKWVTAALVYSVVGLNDAGLLQWLLSGGAVTALIFLYIIKGCEQRWSRTDKGCKNECMESDQRKKRIFKRHCI